MCASNCRGRFQNFNNSLLSKAFFEEYNLVIKVEKCYTPAISLLTLF